MERDRVLVLLAGDWFRAGGAPAYMDRADYVGIAQEAREKCKRPRILIPPRHMAARLNIPLTSHVPEGAREVTDGKKVWFRLDDDERREGEPILHGISHVLCDRSGKLHTEADVWGVFGELAFPGFLGERVHSAERAALLQRHIPKDMLEALILGTLRRLMAERLDVA